MRWHPKEAPHRSSTTRFGKSSSRLNVSVQIQRDDRAGVTRAAMPALGHVERPTHTTACLPKIRRRFHWWLKLLICLKLYSRLIDNFSQIIYFCLRIFYFYSIKLTILSPFLLDLYVIYPC